MQDHIRELEKAILRLDRNVAAEKLRNGLQDIRIKELEEIVEGLAKGLGIVHRRTKGERR